MQGGFGIDFANNTDSVELGVSLVARRILEHGVTSFCPTLVTSPPGSYHMVLPRIAPLKGGQHGATVLGVHCEGPFINPLKKGAHPEEFIQDFDLVYKIPFIFFVIIIISYYRAFNPF